MAQYEDMTGRGKLAAAYCVREIKKRNEKLRALNYPLYVVRELGNF